MKNLLKCLNLAAQNNLIRKNSDKLLFYTTGEWISKSLLHILKKILYIISALFYFAVAFCCSPANTWDSWFHTYHNKENTPYLRKFRKEIFL